LGLLKTEDILPTQLHEKNKEMFLFDLQTVAFLAMKNIIKIADILCLLVQMRRWKWLSRSAHAWKLRSSPLKKTPNRVKKSSRSSLLQKMELPLIPRISKTLIRELIQSDKIAGRFFFIDSYPILVNM
jgi:hypothetical protein